MSQDPNEIRMFTVLDAGTITGSGSTDSNILDLSELKPRGHFGLQLTTAGASSVVQLTYEVSNDGTNYSTPVNAIDIVTAHAPGTAFYQCNPVIGQFIKFVATETAGNDVTSITLIVAMQ